MIFHMKGFVMVLLGVIFVVLLSGSVESVAADHLLKDGKGVFKDEKEVNIASSVDGKYQIHFQMIVRNTQNQLVSVSETVHGYYIPHQITDQIFDVMSGKRGILIVDKIEYEKLQTVYTHGVQEFPFKTSIHDMRLVWYIVFTVNVDGHGPKSLPIFQAATAPVSLAEDDILTFHWTVLRETN